MFKKILLSSLFAALLTGCTANDNTNVTECEAGFVLVDDECSLIESDCFSFEYSGTKEEVLDTRLSEFECKLDEVAEGLNNQLPVFDYYDYFDFKESIELDGLEGVFLSKEELLEYENQIEVLNISDLDAMIIFDNVRFIRDLHTMMLYDYDLFEGVAEINDEEIPLLGFEGKYDVQVDVLPNDDILIKYTSYTRNAFKNEDVYRNHILILSNIYDRLVIKYVTESHNILNPNVDYYTYQEYKEEDAFIELSGNQERGLTSYYRKLYVENSVENGYFDNEKYNFRYYTEDERIFVSFDLEEEVTFFEYSKYQNNNLMFEFSDTYAGVQPTAF